jgi:hypothetical protein
MRIGCSLLHVRFSTRNAAAPHRAAQGGGPAAGSHERL